MFFSTEEVCIKLYQRLSSLQNHLDCGNHRNVLGREALYDEAMLKYAVQHPKYRKTLCLTFKMLVIKLVTRRILYLCRNPRERQDSQVANQVSFRGRQQRKKALKMSKLKPRKTNRLWKEKRPSKIFRRTSRILYPSVIQSCTAITISAIMPPTRNWTSSPSFVFKISVHPFSLTSLILK